MKQQRARPNGFAMMLAIGLLSLVAIVLAVGLRTLRTDLRRTLRQHEETQARLLLLAAQQSPTTAAPKLVLPPALASQATSTTTALPGAAWQVKATVGAVQASQVLTSDAGRWRIETMDAGSGRVAAKQLESSR